MQCIRCACLHKTRGHASHAPGKRGAYAARKIIRLNLKKRIFEYCYNPPIGWRIQRNILYAIDT